MFENKTNLIQNNGQQKSMCTAHPFEKWTNLHCMFMFFHHYYVCSGLEVLIERSKS